MIKERKIKDDNHADTENDFIIINDLKPDIYDQVAEVIDNMGDPCKQLLECFYYKRQNWEKIADSLGYSNAATARNQKYKCLERIRRNF